jgi:ABC-2 type transport system permease protein
MSLWRLEWMRLVRTKRLAALLGVYVFFGLLGPLTTRYLGEILQRFGGNITVILPEPAPADGIAAFAGDAQQIGLLVAVVVGAGALTIDALPEMSIFLRSRVRAAGRLLWPRLVVSMLAAWVAFLAGLAAAWYETAVLLGGLPAGPLLAGAGYGLLYLAFTMTVVAAVAAHSRSVVMGAAISLVLLIVLALPGLVPAVGVWLPSHLVGALDDLVRGGGIVNYLRAAAVTAAASTGLAAWAARTQVRREV